MIVLPWFVRFGLDCTVAMTPIFYFHHHPTLFIFEYFQNRRRIVRRKSIFHPNQPSITSPTSTTSQQCLAKKQLNCSKSWESNSDMPYHNVIDDQNNQRIITHSDWFFARKRTKFPINEIFQKEECKSEDRKANCEGIRFALEYI